MVLKSGKKYDVSARQFISSPREDEGDLFLAHGLHSGDRICAFSQIVRRYAFEYIVDVHGFYSSTFTIGSDVHVIVI